MTWHKHASCIHFRSVLILLSILYFEFPTLLVPCCLLITFQYTYFLPLSLIPYTSSNTIEYFPLCSHIVHASTTWLHESFFLNSSIFKLYISLLLCFTKLLNFDRFFHCFNLNTNTYLYKLSIKSHQKMCTHCQNIVTKTLVSPTQ